MLQLPCYLVSSQLPAVFCLFVLNSELNSESQTQWPSLCDHGAVDVIHHPFLLESFISSAFMMMQLLISVVSVMSLPNHHPPANHPRKPLCGFRVQLSALSLNCSIWKASSALSTAITCMSTQRLALPPSWTFSFHLFKTSLLGGSAITSYPVFLQNAFLPSLFPAIFPEAPYLLSALLSKCLISSWSPFLSSSPTLMFRPCCLTFLLGFPVSFVLWTGIWKVFLSLSVPVLTPPTPSDNSYFLQDDILNLFFYHLLSDLKLLFQSNFSPHKIYTDNVFPQSSEPFKFLPPGVRQVLPMFQDPAYWQSWMGPPWLVCLTWPSLDTWWKDESKQASPLSCVALNQCSTSLFHFKMKINPTQMRTLAG